MTVLCRMKIEWTPGLDEECPGEAVLHVLVGTDTFLVPRVVCRACAALLERAPAFTKAGVACTTRAAHPLGPGCVPGSWGCNNEENHL